MGFLLIAAVFGVLWGVAFISVSTLCLRSKSSLAKIFGYIFLIIGLFICIWSIQFGLEIWNTLLNM